MKNELTKIKTEKYPFPSQDHAPRPEIAAFSEQILQATQDTNNFLGQGEIHFLVRGHYIDVENGVYGIESLIKFILEKNGAVYKKDIADGSLRNIAIGIAMFSDEIEKQIRQLNGSDKYPTQTIRDYLSKFAKDIAKIKLRGYEDKNRTCRKPRTKYYLIAT